MACTGASEDDESFVHSFHLDACSSPELRKAVLGLTQGVQRALAGLAGPVEAWRRHQPLWKGNRAIALDKFKVSQSPPRLLHACLPARKSLIYPQQQEILLVRCICYDA